MCSNPAPLPDNVPALQEMNGFLKTAHSLLENPMPVEVGAIVLEPDYWPRLDRTALERYAQATLRCLPPGTEA